MKILTGAQFKELDQYTIQHEPISAIDLMERAAKAIAEEVSGRWNLKTHFYVFAGPGNNGGDALAVARLLAEKGYRATVYLFNINQKLSEECAFNKECLTEYSNIKLHEVRDQFTFPTIDPQKDVIIDGLFGTGLNKPLNGGFASLAQSINKTNVPVVSIDIPSGLMCEDNTYNDMNTVVRATLTLSLQLPKMAFLFPENQKYVGELKILDIQLDMRYMEDVATNMYLLETETARRLLKKRNAFVHKGNMGHALVVAGSFGMAGASIFCAKACMKAGAGKVTIHTPKMNNDILQIAVPEAILSHDLDDDIITGAIETNGFNAIALGPGIGKSETTALAMRDFMLQQNLPMVLDADVLNILGNHKEWIQDIPKYSILTPHPKELENLIGRCQDSYEQMTKARDLAIKQQLYIVIKGHYSIICLPNGIVLFNGSGNAGMATAGSGDVLSGILVGLLAQGYSNEAAVLLGVHLHGMAGDFAAADLEEECVTASDLIAYLPKAFKELRKKQA